ncbi:MAG: hypothetical protein GY950_28845 [bacterium]|nr:hypothetical protein [bacterium]
MKEKFKKLLGINGLIIVAIIFTVVWIVRGNNSTPERTEIPDEVAKNMKLPSAIDPAPAGVSSSVNESASEAGQQYEGSGTKFEVHPETVEAEKLDRAILIPENVKGKWKAVKLMVRNKDDEEQSEMKTLELGSSFPLDDSLKVTVDLLRECGQEGSTAPFVDESTFSTLVKRARKKMVEKP